MIVNEEDYLAHYGILRRSGRYPWGSGGNVPQRDISKRFLDWIKEMRGQGLTDSEIAQGVGISTTQLRALNTRARAEYKASQIAMAESLRDKGMSNVAAAERMGIPESSYRALLEPSAKVRVAAITATTDMLRRQVEEKGFVDVGTNVENYLGVSKERLNTSLEMLKDEGYTVHTVPVQQLGTNFETHVKVLAPPGTTWGDVRRNQDKIQPITEFSEDGGQAFGKIHEPIGINPKRVKVRYAEEGGAEADGVIYVRPGVDDISLGGASYAQVRVKVGDGHYLKGMAMYKDDLPDGVDLMFNTNKSDTGNKLDAMKKLEPNPEFPFGSIIRRQVLADAGTPNERVTSAMNMVYDEGKWEEWSKNLSSQMLSKQSPTLAREQLGKVYSSRKRELDEIMALTNPTVKKKLLEKYAESADSAAVHLKAAAMPGQATRVILPINSLRPTEIYAPGFKDGERVVLIRHPHGGTFEIPELTVNNRHAASRKLLGDVRDAVGIHHKVAEQLSGADFDGDTVLVIPDPKGRIKVSLPLEGLKNFNPREAYPGYEGMQRISPGRMQQEMGLVSNLITDMTIKGASHEKIARAVRHSMVIIDSEKHGLNWKLSEERNGIRALREEYQNSARGGSSTLISRASGRLDVPDRKPRPQSEGGPIDPRTGKKVYVPTGKTTRSGNPKTIRSKKLAETDDAYTLVSDEGGGKGTRIERIYADHSNSLKDLANQARLAAINTPPLKYLPSSKTAYAEQVSTLDAKLALAKRNAPRERQAQVIANAAAKARIAANPNIDDESKRKIRFQELEKARARMGARKQKIEITPEEWDAIQAGAISNSKLSQILDNADIETVRKLATPRREVLMSPTDTKRAQTLLRSGATRAEVAARLGVSLTTLDRATSE